MKKLLVLTATLLTGCASAPVYVKPIPELKPLPSIASDNPWTVRESYKGRLSLHTTTGQGVKVFYNKLDKNNIYGSLGFGFYGKGLEKICNFKSGTIELPVHDRLERFTVTSAKDVCVIGTMDSRMLRLARENNFQLNNKHIDLSGLDEALTFYYKGD